MKPIGATLAVAALLTCVVAVGSGSAAPRAQSSVVFTSCNIDGKQQRLGTSYVTSLKVAGVGCAKAQRVIKAYHQCRHSNGGAEGSCADTVLGFACKDGARQAVPGVQYNATAKCRKSSNAGKRIKSRYTQNI